MATWKKQTTGSYTWKHYLVERIATAGEHQWRVMINTGESWFMLVSARTKKLCQWAAEQHSGK